MNRLPKIDVITIIVSAYLINMFRINLISIALQKIVVWVICILFLLINHGYVIRLFYRNNISKIIIGFILLSLYFLGAMIAFFIGPHDASYIRMMFSMILLFIYMLVICVRLMKKGHENNILMSFFSTYINCMVIYVIVTILMIVFPEVKTSFFEILSMDEFSMEKVSNLYYGTRIGWMGFSGYNCGLKCSLGCCMCLYFIIENINNQRRNNPIVYLYLFILLVGNIFYSRTGLIISVLCCVCALLYIAFIEGKIWTFLMYCFTILIVVSIGMAFISANIEKSLTMQWAFEMIDNFLNTGKFSASSYSKLQAMYFFPPIGTIIAGDGRYAGNGIGYYMDVDVGLMRNIFYFGIFGSALLYGAMLYLIRHIGKANKGIIGFLFFLLFLGYEFKGESTPLLLPLLYLILLLSYYSPIYDDRTIRFVD